MARVDGLFAGVLERRRESFNARFTLARRELPALEPEAALTFLRERMPPIAEAVHRESPEAVDLVCERLFGVALPLLAKELLGGRSAALVLVWDVLLPALPRQLVAEPELTARALSNAMFAIEAHPGAGADRWAAAVLDIAPHTASVGELLEAGKVLAWRAGMAHYRRSALAVAAGLPPALVARCLGLEDPDRVPGALARLDADPWADPARPTADGPRIQARVGGFRGLGGPFLAPPRVATVDGGLVVHDGHGTFTLHADRFGWACMPSPGSFPEPVAAGTGGLWDRLSRALGSSGPEAPPLAPDGTVSLGGKSQRFPQLAGNSSYATDGRTLAVTHPQSHFVTLVAPGPA